MLNVEIFEMMSAFASSDFGTEKSSIRSDCRPRVVITILVRLTRYPSSYPVDYVLEVNAGFTDKYDIKVGQSLSGLEQL